MAQITFTIPDDKISRVIDAMKGVFEIPEDDNGEPLFTDVQWAKEKVRRWIINQVARWEHRVAVQNINIVKDDDLVT